jgi:hypothetical protein
MKFPTGQHRFQHIGGVHRALGGSCPHDRVKFIDEQDYLAVGIRDILQYCLQTFLKFAAELGASDQGTQIK